MPIYKVEAPDGKLLKIEGPEGASEQDILAIAAQLYQPPEIKPDTGFTGAFSAGKERLKGDIALLAGKTGLMGLEDAERYKREKDILAQRMFKPTEEGFTEAPFLKFRELLGGSLPYMAAPLAAGVGAKALGVGAGVGLAGAGLASLGQFTGSNLSRQVETGKSLEEASLGKAAAAAVPQTALDVVSLRMIPSIGKLFGAAGKEVTPELAKKIAEQGMLRTTAAYGAGSAKLAGVEGATEVGQQFLERLQAGLNISDQQARDEYFDSFIGGAVLGGTLAVPGTYLERGATVRQGKQMEEEQKQQAIIDRQKAQQEAQQKAALEQRQQIDQTKQNLGVPETLALPAPDKKYVEPSEDDPLFNPLGRFQTTDLSAKEITEINQRRQAMGKARIGKTFSIEDLADVFTPEETQTAEGVLGRLVASRTGFQAGDDISPETLNLAAQQRGISTDTQGFRDFLERTTGTNSLENMSPPQRLAVKQALENIPEGAESQVLQAGITTVKHYTPEQYTQTLGGINKEFAEVGNKPNGRESVLKQIEKYSGLTRRKDQQRLLDQAILSGDLERVVEVRNVNGVEKNVEMIQKPTPRQELPGGMDIRRETFKQGEAPDLYEIRSGSRVINQKETAEEAEEELVIHEKNRQAKVIDLEKKIASLQNGIQKREADLLNDRSLGQDQDNAFFIKSANYYGQDQVANQDIANLRQQQQTFAQPIQIVPVGTRALTQNKFTYYEKGKPTVKFDSAEQAEAYGISRLNDQTLQQIIDSASAQKQTGRVKRYVNLAQKELDSRTGKKPAGIEITTKQGLEGAEKRLEELGLVKAEAQKKLTDNIETLRKSLLPTLKRFGLEKVGLNIVESIENGKADGSYVKNLITLALDAKDVMGTLRHESIHALKELGGFTDAEWRVLTQKAKTEWVQKFIKDRGLFKRYQDQYKQDYGSLKGFDEYIQEEAIAEAFRFYSKNKLPAGMIGNIIVRLQKFFEALRNSLNSLGFTTATDIFNKIEEGGIKTLEPVKAEAKPARMSFATAKKDITPLDVQQVKIYENELESLIKKIGDRIVGMKSEETLADVRKAVEKLQSYTAQGLKGRDWYERSAKAVLDAFNNDAVLAEKFFQVIAITSAKTEVAANFTKTANAWTQFAEGRPIKVGTENENKKVNALLNFGEEWDGRKTNTFYGNLMEAMDGKDSGRSTIDLHMTRMIFGKDVPTDAQYELAENMVRLLASKLDVAPRQIQAASWVTQKAKTMFEDYRAKGWKKDLSDEELSQFAFERAVADYSHQMQKRVSQLPITGALREPSKEIKTRVQNITGEVIPSVQSEMAQAEELNFKYKEKLTKEIADADTIQAIAKYIGVTSKIRVTVGSGAYAKKVNPNLIVQIINDDADVAEKDALDMANAMSYVFKQDATPFFRADPKLIDTDQIGFKLKFDTATLTPTQQKKILAIFQNKFGNDAGFTRIRSNELVIINYRGENGKPFLVPDEEFMQGLADIRDEISEISSIESQEMFGAKSEYPYHDWKEEPSGVGIVAGIQNRRPEQPDIQRGLDDFRESFVGSVRQTIRESGKEPKFSFRAEEVAPESKYSLALGNIDPTTFLVSEKNPNNTGNLAFMPGAAPFAKYPIRLPVGTHDDISDQGYGANHILRRMQTDVKRRPAEVTKERLEDLILHIENLGKRFKRVYRSGTNLVLYDPLTDDAMFVKPLSDHYEVQSMYSDARIPTKYGNAAWSGKNIQPPEAKKFEEKQRGILVQASREGRVEPKPVGVKVKRVLSPNQIETEANKEPTKGTLSLKKKMSLRAPDAWYYSQLERGIESTPDRIFGRAPQIKAWLTSNASKMGVKSEELQFSGINDFLELKGNEKVSKDEILNYLQQGGVRLEEVNKSEQLNETKYQDYQLDGGTNYQEMLITLPEKQISSNWKVVKNNPNKKEYFLYSSTLKDYALGEDNRTAKVWNSAEEAKDAIKDYAPTQDVDPNSPRYKSSHWSEENILAHIRMNDRKDRDGNKVLFIEELQSDWHQAGRKKGYEEPLPQNLNPSDLLWEYGPKLSPSQKNDLRDFIERYELNGITQVIDEGLVPKAMQQELMNIARKSLDDEYKAWLKGKTTETGIPSAPFKDTKAWTGLALKRIISYATENGYDKVAFINGEQSADRYNIRDKIDNIVYEKTDSNTYDVDALKDGLTIYAKDDISLDEVEETFGKEIAEKIKNGVDSSLTKKQAKEKIDEAISKWEAKAKRGELGVYEDGEIEKYVDLMRDDPGAYSGTLRDIGLTREAIDKYQGRGYRNKKELSGLDLKVGGEGMINYYDKILPQVASDVLRKIGGGNLEKVIVPVRIMISGNKEFTYSVVSDLTNNNAYVQNNKTGKRVTEPMTYDEAKDWLHANDPATSNPQTGFSITEKIREKVSTGIPLFSLRAPDSPEVDAFMNRIEGKSKIVNEDGTPKIMYHGTARDITEFKPKQADAIFLSPTPRFAEGFADSSRDYVAKETFSKLPFDKQESIAKEMFKMVVKNGFMNKGDAKFGKQFILSSPDSVLSSSFKKYGMEPWISLFMEPYMESNRNIIPVYTYARKPFDYQNKEDIKDLLSTESGKDIYEEEISLIEAGAWTLIEKPHIQKAIKDAGFDGFYVKEGGNKNLAVYDSSQIKSAFNVAPTKESKDIRFSFNVAPESHTKLEQVNTYGKTLTDTITSIFKMFKDPEERIKNRIAFIDPNSSLARSLQDQEIYKNGILRADLLARAKATLINLIRNGLQTGIPVVNSDGSLIIEIDEVNNLANSRIMADRLNDNYYVKGSELSGRAFVAEVARALRGKEIMEEDRIHNAKTGENRNREKQVTQKQIDWAEQQLKNVPEMQEIFDIWKKVNTGLINLWESVGLFSKAEADTYRAKKFYVSLAASNTDLETMMESQLGFTAAGLKSTPKVQKLEGAEYLRDKSGKVVLDENGDPVPLKRNIWENIDKQYASMMAGAYQNQVRKIAVQQLMDANAASIPTKKRNGIDVGNPNAEGINLRYKDPTNPLADDKGVVHAIVDNATDLAAFESMHYELGPVLKFFGGATNILRAGALLNPMFWIRQLIRDPIHASIVANGGIVTPFHSAKEYINILRKNSEEAKILASRGVIGQYDSTLDLYTFLDQVGTEKVNQGNVQKAFHKLMQMHEASDAATRVAIFKKEKQSALEKGMTEEEAVNYAVMKAREAINFLVHGNSKTLNAARQMIPFLSASITSLDTVYRAATGYNLPASEKEAAKKLFKQRAALMFGASFAYAMLMQDDEEYQKQPNYVKDNNWLIKNPIGEGFLKVPVPYEVGFLFKVVPEVALRYAYGNDTGKEMIKAYKDGLLHNLPTGGVPVPQAIKPALETIVNYSFFTGNPVESIGDARLPVEARGRNASETAKFLSGAGLGFVGLSPSKIDNLVQGYFAEAGTFMFGLADQAVYTIKGTEAAAKNLEKQPFFKAFMTDPNADKAVANFYDIQQTANRTVQGFNELKNSGRLEEAREIVEDEEKKMLIASAPTLRKFSENMTKVRRQIEIVKGDQSRTPEERRELINKLTAQYNIIAQQGVRAADKLGIR